MMSQRVGKRAIGMLLLLSPVVAQAAHFVDVRTAAAIRECLTVTLRAEVLDRTDGDSVARVRSYHLRVAIPEGTVPDVRVGSSIRVSLPVVHHAEAFAKVMSVTGGDITVLLSDQIQQLDGLRLKADLPLKPVNLYRIPFQAVYSPRGITTETFVFDGARVSLVRVAVLEIHDDGGIVVSSSHLADARVVVNGLDNLVSGDEVNLMPAAQEVAHD
jgi:hypothetical protein